MGAGIVASANPSLLQIHPPGAMLYDVTICRPQGIVHHARALRPKKATHSKAERVLNMCIQSNHRLRWEHKKGRNRQVRSVWVNAAAEF
jgi:hypothetical protein